MQVTKIRNESDDISINLTEIKRIIRENYEKVVCNKLDNLDEMDKFLKTHKLPKPTQEQIENMNRPITSKETESVIKDLPTKKIQNQMVSLVNSTKHLKKN